MSNALGNAARSSGLSFAGSLVSAIAGFALSLVLARMLGPSGSGIVFQMMSVFTIAGAVAKLGLDTTAVWLLPRLASDRRNDVRRATGIILLGALFGGIAAGLVLLAIAPLFNGASDDLADIIRIAAIFLPLSSVATVGLAITRGLGGVRDFVLIGSVGLPVGRLAAVTVATAFAATAAVASAAWLAVLVAVVVLALLAVHRAIRRFQQTDTSEVTTRSVLVRRVAAFSAPRTLSSTIEQALLWLDVLIVGLILGPAAAGVYGVVSRLVQAGTIPSTSMRIVVAPQFSRMLHQGRVEELGKFFSQTAQWIVLFSMPIYVLLAVLAQPILQIFGPGFEEGAAALAIMCLGAAVSASTGNIQSLLLMSGRSGWAAVNKVIVLAVSLSLLFLLVPTLGIVGAAIAWTISTSLDAILATIQVRRVVSLRSGFSAVLVAVVAAGLATAVPAVASRLVFGDTGLALIVGCVSGALAWTGVVFVMRRRFALDRIKSLLSRKPQ